MCYLGQSVLSQLHKRKEVSTPRRQAVTLAHPGCISSFQACEVPALLLSFILRSYLTPSVPSSLILFFCLQYSLFVSMVCLHQILRRSADTDRKNPQSF